jgi:DNA polymerase III delta subunit
MITLIHGDDRAKSRDELQKIKRQHAGKEIRVLQGKGIEDHELLQALSSHSLFGGDVVVIIEHLLATPGKKVKRAQELCSIIKTANADVVLWEEKEIGKSILTGLGSNVDIRLFKLPTVLFAFLDAIRPGHAKQLLSLYQSLIKKEAPDVIHAMLQKRLRQLLLLKAGHKEENLSSWQLARLTNQAKPFTLERLISVYKQLKIMQYQRNSGQAVFELKESTEILLCTI